MYIVISNHLSNDRYDNSNSLNSFIYIFDNVNDANVKHQNSPNSTLLQIPNGSKIEVLGNLMYDIYDNNNQNLYNFSSD